MVDFGEEIGSEQNIELKRSPSIGIEQIKGCIKMSGGSLSFESYFPTKSLVLGREDHNYLVFIFQNLIDPNQLNEWGLFQLSARICSDV